jgi:hypothetical protein
MKSVCVLGTIRSGKTLIGRALDMNASITLQTEPFFFYFKLCRNIFIREILKKKDGFDGPMAPFFCTPKSERKLFEKHFSSLVFSEEDIRQLKVLTRKQQVSVEDERAPEIISYLETIQSGSASDVLSSLLSILNRAYPKKSVDYVGFSEAWCEGFMTPLMSLRENPFKCIHVIRDPRSVICSRNAGKNLIEEYGGKYPILFLIRHWRTSVAHAIINQENPNYFMVRYEDLVTSPDHWFKAICDFLNVKLEKMMLEPEKYVNGMGKPWKQNTNFEQKKGFSTTSLYKWKDVLSEKEIGFIEWLCLPEMNYMGYETTKNNYSLSELLNFYEDSNDIVEWLKSYNLTVSDQELEVEIARRYLLTQDIHKAKDLISFLYTDEKNYQTLWEGFSHDFLNM